MTVIINEFEVVAEAPPRVEAEAPPPEEQMLPLVPTPLDISRVLDQQAARLVRVWAC